VQWHIVNTGNLQT